MKYNGNIYSRQVPGKLKTHEYTSFFLTYNPWKFYFTNPPNFEAFCGTNKYLTIIYFKI